MFARVLGLYILPRDCKLLMQLADGYALHNLGCKFDQELPCAYRPLSCRKYICC